MSDGSDYYNKYYYSKWCEALRMCKALRDELDELQRKNAAATSATGATAGCPLCGSKRINPMPCRADGAWWCRECQRDIGYTTTLLPHCDDDDIAQRSAAARQG